MYLFSRTTLATLGKQFEAVPKAVEIAATASSIMGLDVNTFVARFGAPQGTVMWSVMAESHAQMQEATDKLMADSGYIDAVEGMTGLFMTPAEDRFSRFVSDVPADAAGKRYYGVTRAQMADGKYAEAIAFGLEIRQYVSDSSGLPAAFLKAAYGGFSDVTWILGADSMDEIDAYQDWQMSDQGYLDRLNQAAGLFLPGTGENSLIEKVN